MSNYIKLPKTSPDDSLSSGPMPYELPCHQEEENPNIESTTTSVVNPCGTSEIGSEIPLINSDAWEQFRQVMSEEDPTTLLAGTPKSRNNKRSAGCNLQDEYLNGFPELLKAVSDNKKTKRGTTVTGHAPLAATLSTREEQAMAESEALDETTFPISCIIKSQSFMGTEGDRRFQEFFSDVEIENPEGGCG